MFKSLEPFRKEVVVDEPSKDNATIVLNFFSCDKKYQHQEPFKDLDIPGMTVEEFWKDGDKDYNEFEYEKPLVTKTSPYKFDVTLEEVTRVVLSCMCMWLACV
jgi:hypothetical protein